MGEIERVHPIYRPILGPRATDRIRPESGRHHSPDHDPEEPSRPEQADEPQVAENESSSTPAESGHGLDLTI